MAAASPLPLAAIFRKQRTTLKGQEFAFPPVYPFPTPKPACAVIAGVSPRSPSPYSAYDKRKRKRPAPQNKRTKHAHKVNILKAGLLLLHPLPLSLGIKLGLRSILLDARGLRTRSLPLLPPWWGWRPPPPCCVLGDRRTMV